MSRPWNCDGYFPVCTQCGGLMHKSELDGKHVCSVCFMTGNPEWKHLDELTAQQKYICESRGMVG